MMTKALNLRDAGMTDADVVRLAASDRPRDLLWLDLSFNDLTVVSLEAIATSPNMASLRYLGFAGNLVPSPVDAFAVDSMDGSIIEWWSTEEGRRLEERARAVGINELAWLRAPSRFRGTYPPTPEDVLGSRRVEGA